MPEQTGATQEFTGQANGSWSMPEPEKPEQEPEPKVEPEVAKAEPE